MSSADKAFLLGVALTIVFAVIPLLFVIDAVRDRRPPAPDPLDDVHGDTTNGLHS